MTVFDDILEMWIAPRRDGSNWTVRDWLAVDFSTEEGWHQAIDIFEDRIRGRFLNMIDAIQGKRYAGFAVLALDCLLIETLQQFRKGVPDSDRNSRRYFVDFLTETSFRLYFGEDKGEGGLADMFYKQIRNGILHQAETKESSRIVTRRTEPLVRRTQDGQGLVINRRRFHEQLACEFEDYVERLRDPTSKDLRGRFKRKMNHICRIPAEE